MLPEGLTIISSQRRIVVAHLEKIFKSLKSNERDNQEFRDETKRLEELTQFEIAEEVNYSKWPYSGYE